MFLHSKTRFKFGFELRFLKICLKEMSFIFEILHVVNLDKSYLTDSNKCYCLITLK